jgi:hypothetical protein
MTDSVEIVSHACLAVSNQDGASCDGDDRAKGEEVVADGQNDFANGGRFW